MEMLRIKALEFTNSSSLSSLPELSDRLDGVEDPQLTTNSFFSVNVDVTRGLKSVWRSGEVSVHESSRLSISERCEVL
jgi:hypothetical protein